MIFIVATPIQSDHIPAHERRSRISISRRQFFPHPWSLKPSTGNRTIQAGPSIDRRGLASKLQTSKVKSKHTLAISIPQTRRTHAGAAVYSKLAHLISTDFSHPPILPTSFFQPLTSIPPGCGARNLLSSFTRAAHIPVAPHPLNSKRQALLDPPR